MQTLKQSYQSLAGTISVKAKGGISAACLLAQAPIRCEAGVGIHSVLDYVPPFFHRAGSRPSDLWRGRAME